MLRDGGGSRASVAEELRALVEEVAGSDSTRLAWRGLVAALAASEVWQSRALEPGAASDAFVTALQANSGPVADTFMATRGRPPPRDRAGRIERAVDRALSVARALSDHDHSAPGQRLLQNLRRRGGWLVGEPLEASSDGIAVVFVGEKDSFLAAVRLDEPSEKARLTTALGRALDTGDGLATVDRRASAPTPAAVAISVDPVSERWARSFHRAAWTRGGGPWMGIADSPPYEVISTCHSAVDGYAHARMCSEVFVPGGAALPVPVSAGVFAGVAKVQPPAVGFASRTIVGATLRFATALHAFASVLDARLGGSKTRSEPFHVPVAPGHRSESARWRRRPLYGLMALRREAGALESPEALAERLPAFLAREGSGGGLLARVLRATIELPVPNPLRRSILAQSSTDRWFSPARVLTGGGYLSWMRFPAGEAPPLPVFPSAIPSFSAGGRGGAGLSITSFTEGLAIGLTTSGDLGTREAAEQFLDDWTEALPVAVRGSTQRV